jgi:hypothetical protein
MGPVGQKTVSQSSCTPRGFGLARIMPHPVPAPPSCTMLKVDLQFASTALLSNHYGNES